MFCLALGAAFASPAPLLAATNSTTNSANGNATATPLVSTAWLAENIDNPALRVIDLRSKLDSPEGGNAAWLAGHIPGSVHSDYLEGGWLVTRDEVIGMLPDAARFSANARDNLGISADSHVVLVPAGKTATDFGAAARAYWTLKVYGLQRVSVLDGGYAAWARDFPGQVETGPAFDPDPGDFTAILQDHLRIRKEDVATVLGRPAEAILVDSRSRDEYRGVKKHPQATRPGHIPGAVSLDQERSFDAETGKLRPLAELRELYAGLEPGRRVIIYCNTGHWASANWFVLTQLLGRENVRLYDGSLVEWTVDAALPMERENNLTRIREFIRARLG